MKYLRWFLCFSLFLLLFTGCIGEIKVEFETGTDETIDSIMINKGETLSELPKPTKEGYDFAGWYLDQDCTEEYTDQAIKKKTVLYADWTIKQFTVVFKNGNVSVHTETVDYGNEATPPEEEPTRIGHTFTGWDKPLNNITENLVVNALFEINVFTVTFKDDDEVIDEQEVSFGGEATAPTPPEKEGYTFSEWDKSFNSITEDLIVNAVYERIQYEVKFVDTDGTVLSLQNVYHGDDATAPDEPSQTGYEFIGWDTDFDNVTENLIITAEYQLVTYTITYYDNENLLAHEPTSYDIENGIELEPFSKDGMEFAGWYLDDEFTGEPVTCIPIGNSGNYVLYGRWANVFDIEYELNGGSWYFTSTTVTDASDGIDAYTNLPEILMIDFYTYLKDNDLLTSSVVAASLHQTTWNDFSKNYTDPVAIYNHTTTNTSQTNDGYSQFFCDEATGNDLTGELYTISGGFFGTEPYKSKYLHLIQIVSIMQRMRYTVNLWDGENGKSLAGFVLDGYLYGTQSILESPYDKLREAIPQPNKGYSLEGTDLVPFNVNYPVNKHLDINKTYLSLPHKEGFAFDGWYATDDFSDERIYFLNPEDTVAEKYYAKWIPIEDY